MQAACVQGADPYMQQWAGPDLVDLDSLPMQPGSHGKHHSPMEDSITDFGGDNPDYLKLLEVRPRRFTQLLQRHNVSGPIHVYSS